MLSILLLLSTDNVDFESKAYLLFTIWKDDIGRELQYCLTEGNKKAMKGAPREVLRFPPVMDKGE